MVIGLQLPFDASPLNGLLSKSTSKDSETAQSLSFGEILKAKEQQITREINLSSSVVALAVMQRSAKMAPMLDLSVVEKNYKADIRPALERGLPLQIVSQDATSGTSSLAQINQEATNVELQKAEEQASPLFSAATTREMELLVEDDVIAGQQASQQSSVPQLDFLSDHESPKDGEQKSSRVQASSESDTRLGRDNQSAAETPSTAETTVFSNPLRPVQLAENDAGHEETPVHTDLHKPSLPATQPMPASVPEPEIPQQPGNSRMPRARMELPSDPVAKPMGEFHSHSLDLLGDSSARPAFETALIQKTTPEADRTPMENNPGTPRTQPDPQMNLTAEVQASGFRVGSTASRIIHETATFDGDNSRFGRSNDLTQRHPAFEVELHDSGVELSMETKTVSSQMNVTDMGQQLIRKTDASGALQVNEPVEESSIDKAFGFINNDETDELHTRSSVPSTSSQSLEYVSPSTTSGTEVDHKKVNVEPQTTETERQTRTGGGEQTRPVFAKDSEMSVSTESVHATHSLDENDNIFAASTFSKEITNPTLDSQPVLPGGSINQEVMNPVQSEKKSEVSVPVADNSSATRGVKAPPAIQTERNQIPLHQSDLDVTLPLEEVGPETEEFLRSDVVSFNEQTSDQPVISIINSQTEIPLAESQHQNYQFESPKHISFERKVIQPEISEPVRKTFSHTDAGSAAESTLPEKDAEIYQGSATQSEEMRAMVAPSETGVRDALSNPPSQATPSFKEITVKTDGFDSSVEPRQTKTFVTAFSPASTDVSPEHLMPQRRHQSDTARVQEPDAPNMPLSTTDADREESKADSNEIVVESSQITSEYSLKSPLKVIGGAIERLRTQAAAETTIVVAPVPNPSEASNLHVVNTEHGEALSLKTAQLVDHFSSHDVYGTRHHTTENVRPQTVQQPPSSPVELDQKVISTPEQIEKRASTTQSKAEFLLMADDIKQNDQISKTNSIPQNQVNPVEQSDLITGASLRANSQPIFSVPLRDESSTPQVADAKISPDQQSARSEMNASGISFSGQSGILAKEDSGGPEAKADQMYVANDSDHQIEKEDGRNQRLESVSGMANLLKENVTGFSVENKPTVLTDPQAVEVVQEVIRQLNVKLKGDPTTMHLQLNPESLGAIEVEMVRDAQGVSVTFFAEQAGTVKLLETQLGQLRQSLADSGVQLSGLNIGQHPHTGQEGGFHHQNTNFAQTPARETLHDEINTRENPRVERAVGQTSEVDYRI